jgi:Zn-dependent M28 family amino/carboxypeptidase
MRRAFLLLFILAACVPAARSPQPVPDSALVDAGALLHDVQILSADDMEGRATDTRGGKKARAYVVDRFRQSGIRPFGDGYEQPFQLRTKQGETLAGANIVGYLPGSETGGRALVVTAHYDHLGIRGGQIYNGADDNASGTAALFALAGYLARHPARHMVIFVAFDAEEIGLDGSAFFVGHPPVPQSSMALDLNMDMVSRNDRHELYVAGTRYSPFLKPWLEPLAHPAGLTLVFGHDAPEPEDQDWTSQSDHAAFHEAGIPFLYFGVEDHADYHRPTDDFDRIQPAFYVRAVETIARAVTVLDDRLDEIPAGRG